MALDPQVQALLTQMEAQGARPFAELGVGEGADLPIALAPGALRAFPASGPAA